MLNDNFTAGFWQVCIQGLFVFGTTRRRYDIDLFPQVSISETKLYFIIVIFALCISSHVNDMIGPLSYCNFKAFLKYM